MTDALIAALEKATGPDRELDSAITTFMFPDQDWPLVRAYTASIDAAMGLVGPEWRVYAIQEEYITPRGNWFAGLDHRTEHYKNGSKIGKGPTPAIALCIAALKAIAAQRGGG